MKRPLLSIVIANYNYGRYLEKAIQSVIAQGMGNRVELIICDADSSDNSIDIIRKYEKYIAWWCSEKDGGQSAAFNKGFSHAQGEWLTWLNADDLLIAGALEKFIKVVDRNKEAEWVTANMVSFESDSGRIKHLSWGPHVHPFFLRKNHAPHAVFGPTSFFKKALYERMGPIDEKLHYAMDVDYWARLTMAGVRQCRLNCLCWGFRIHDESKTAGDQSNGVGLARDIECDTWHRQNSYYYDYKLTNPWYVVWMMCRLVDGSLIIRVLKSIACRGKTIWRIMGA